MHALHSSGDRNLSASRLLQHFAKVGDAETVRRLLVHEGADPLWRDPCFGLNALHYAAWSGHLEVVQALLEHGGCANPDDASAGWGSPLHLACETGSVAVVRELLQRGARCDAAAGTPSSTPLAAALRSPDLGARPALLRLLLFTLTPEEVDQRFGEQGTTALIEAAKAGDLEGVRVLLLADADAGLTSPDAAGAPTTAAAWARSAGHHALANLIEHPGAASPRACLGGGAASASAAAAPEDPDPDAPLP